MGLMLTTTTTTPLNPSKKRKRRRVVMNDDEDDEAHIRLPRAMATVDKPPTFSASSPSSLPPPPAPVIRGECRKKKPVKGKQDTDDVPPPERLDSDPPKEKSPPKPKKKPSVRPKPGDAGQPSSVSASTSQPGSNVKDPVYKNAEIVEDSDEEGESFVLPRLSRRPDPESPLSDLSEPTGPGISEPVALSNGHKRSVPKVVITTVPRERTSCPVTREVEERGSVDRDGVNGSPKGNKRQKKVAGYLDDLGDKAVVVPRKGSKDKGKVPPKGKSRTRP
jgi:hypothetical protein